VAKSGRLEVTSRNGLRGVSASERGQESEKFPLLVLGRPQGKPFRYGISDGREKISVFFQYHMNQPEPFDSPDLEARAQVLDGAATHAELRGFIPLRPVDGA
jgi:hypothetical protein